MSGESLFFPSVERGKKTFLLCADGFGLTSTTMIKQALFSILFVRAAGFVSLSTTTLSRHSRAAVRVDTQHHESSVPVDLGLAKFFGRVATVPAFSLGIAPATRKSNRIDDTRESRMFGLSAGIVVVAALMM